MKKLLPIMIVAAMFMACLVIINADDSDADIDTGFWVNNQQITREADASGDGWKYVKATNTLVLTDGTFSTNHTDVWDGGLFFDSHQRCSPIYYTYGDKLTIELHGNNVIKGYGPGRAGGDLSANGILIYGDLEITGDGALDIKGGGTNGIIVDGKLTISGGIISIGGSHDYMHIWATEDGMASGFTMTDGRLHLLKNENPDSEQLLFYSDGNFTVSGGVINTAGIIRGFDDPFVLSGGIIKNSSMEKDKMILEFGSFNYGGSSKLVNLEEVASGMVDNEKLVALANGAASVGTEPAKKYVTLNANEGSCDKYFVETGTDGKLASIPDATRDGYTFDGWYTAADGGDKIDVSKVYTDDTTIYAHWTKSGGNDSLPLIIGGVIAGIVVIGAVAFLIIRKH